MKMVLLACAALIPALAFAEDPKPYILHNGRGPTAPPAASPAAAGSGAATGSFQGVTTQAGVFGSKAVNPNTFGVGDVTSAAVAAATASSGERSFHGSRRATMRRGVAKRGVETPADAPPPNYSKPGALIRTEGQLPVYTDPGNARTHSVEGGGIIEMNQRYAQNVGRASGVALGAPDKPPSANPNSGSGAGGNAITANGPAIPKSDDRPIVHHEESRSRESSSISGFDPAF